MKNDLFVYGPPDTGKTILNNILLSQLNESYNLNYYMKNGLVISDLEVKPDDKLIFIFRDPRICWLLSEHKFPNKKKIEVMSIEKYCRIHNRYFMYLQDYLEKDNFFYLKYEDLLNNFLNCLDYVFSFIDQDLTEDVLSLKPEVFMNKYTRFDINQITKFLNRINQEEFDYISETLNELILFFNYPESFDVKMVNG